MITRVDGLPTLERDATAVAQLVAFVLRRDRGGPVTLTLSSARS